MRSSSASRAAPAAAGLLAWLLLAAVAPAADADAGVRHWREPFTRIGAQGAYVSVIVRDGTYELWCNTYGGPDAPASAHQVVVRTGPALDRLGPREARLDSSLATDVFDPQHPGTPAPGRLITRPWVTWDPHAGYVLLACVPPTYSPGSVTMVPTLSFSPDGAPGTWRYTGVAAGDIAAEIARRRVWSDGGSLQPLAGGRWRMYTNGFGPVLCALEADTLAGPWHFLRDAQGAIRELLPGFPRSPAAGGCFPAVIRAGPQEWHAWLSDTWPVQAVWHFSSADGLTWTPYGTQPEITRAAVNGQAIKCLRAFVDPGADGDIVGLLSVWEEAEGKPAASPGAARTAQQEWELYRSRLPRGLQPPPEPARPR